MSDDALDFLGVNFRDEIAMSVMHDLIMLTGGHWYDEDVVAHNAYKMADAMIAEREKGLH
jgi:hypothetical protein